MNIQRPLCNWQTTLALCAPHPLCPGLAPMSTIKSRNLIWCTALCTSTFPRESHGKHIVAHKSAQYANVCLLALPAFAQLCQQLNRQSKQGSNTRSQDDPRYVCGRRQLSEVDSSSCCHSRRQHTQGERQRREADAYTGELLCGLGIVNDTWCAIYEEKKPLF